MNDFAEFWSLYPRRVSKRAAQKAWDKEVKSGALPQDIIFGLRQQLRQLCSKDIQFIPHASTWLNQARYEDEVQEVTTQQGNRRTIADAARDLLTGYEYSSNAFGVPAISRH